MSALDTMADVAMENVWMVAGALLLSWAVQLPSVSNGYSAILVLIRFVILHVLVWLRRKLRSRFQAWLLQYVGQSFATKDQIAATNNNLVTKKDLANQLRQLTGKYVTEEELRRKNFVRSQDLNNKDSNIRTILKRQNEEMFVKKSEFATQLDQHFKTSLAKERIDHRLQALQRNITEQVESFVSKRQAED